MMFIFLGGKSTIIVLQLKTISYSATYLLLITTNLKLNCSVFCNSNSCQVLPFYHNFFVFENLC